MRKACAFAFLITLMIAFTGCASGKSVVNKVGNTAANIINGGYATQQGDWIYYENNGIYKIRANGMFKTKICGDKSFNLNVAGDWIYYINSDDKYSLYKIRMNGTQRTRILEQSPFYDFTVAGDWIYYRDEAQQNIRVRTDGTESEAIGANMMSLNFCGDWIYYLNAADNGSLYKMKPDGSEPMKLNNYSGTTLVVDEEGGWIYFLEKSTSKICKTAVDGYYYTTVNDDQAGEFNFDGEWIYYRNNSDGGKIYRMKTDGSGKVRLNEDPSSKINLTQDYVYFSVYSKAITIINRFRKDGSKLAVICVVATPLPTPTPIPIPSPTPRPLPTRTPIPVFRTPLPSFKPYVFGPDDISEIQPLHVYGLPSASIFDTSNADGSVKAYIAEDKEYYYLIVQKNDIKIAAHKIVKNVPVNSPDNKAENILYPVLNDLGTMLAFHIGIYYPVAGDVGSIVSGPLYIYNIAENKLITTGIKINARPDTVMYCWNAADDRLIIKDGRINGSDQLIGLYDPAKGVVLNLHDNESDITEGSASVSPDKRLIAYNKLNNVRSAETGMSEIDLVIYDFQAGVSRTVINKSLPYPYIGTLFETYPFVDNENILKNVDNNAVLYNVNTGVTRILIENAIKLRLSSDRKLIGYNKTASSNDPKPYYYDIATGISEVDDGQSSAVNQY